MFTYKKVINEFLFHYFQEKTALQIFMQIVAQNVNKETINVVEIQNYTGEDTIYKEVQSLKANIPGLKVQFTQLKKDDFLKNLDQSASKIDLVLVQNLNMDDSVSIFGEGINLRNILNSQIGSRSLLN